MEESFISAQARVSKAFIQETIEAQLRGILGQDGLALDLPQGALLIEHVDNVKYQVSNQDIVVAADIEVEYNNEEAINVVGQGTIHLVVFMAYEIKPDFTLSTETKLKEHTWIEKPSLKIGRLKIPSKAALDLLISRFDEEFGKKIDAAIAQKVDLQKIVTQQLAKFENPIPNNFDQNIHLTVKPSNLLFNIQEQGGHYLLTVHTSFGAEVNWEKRANTKIFSELPHIQEFDGRSMPSEIYVPVKVNYDVLAAMLNEQFAQIKVMEEDLKVSQIQLAYRKNVCHVSANIAGTVSGALSAQLVPRLDADKQTLHLEQLQYEIQSSSFLVKAAVFLFKGKIDQKIDQFSTIDLNPIFDKLKSDLNSKLKQIVLEGVKFKVRLDDLEVSHLAFFESFCMAQVKVKANGQLAVS